MAKCPVCKIEQSGYSWTTTKNGKKWLADSNGKWHDCPASTSKFKTNETYVKRIPLIDKDFEFCYLCDTHMLTAEAHNKYTVLFYTSMEEHINKNHTNNEILDDIDLMVLTDEQKEKMRILWNQPKRTTQYNRIGKLTK